MARSEMTRTMLSASGLTILGSIAPFLLGAQAVLVQRELGFGPAGLGAAVSIFFGTAAVVTILGGAALQRRGRRVGLVAAGLLIAVGNLGLAGLAHDLPVLLAAMVVLGAANGACQATSNAAVATALPQHRRGLGFGIKQSAVPAAIMFGGLAVPTTTMLLGWRSTFVITGLLGLVVVAVGIFSTGTRTPKSGSRTATGGAPAAQDRAPVGALLLCAVGIILANGAANFVGAYLALWAHQVGLSLGQAGMLVATGSGSAMLMRILLGHLADRRHGGNLGPIAVQMFVGGLCLALIGAVPQAWAVVLFGILAFAIGWSWPGLFLYAVARLGRDAPAQAASALQAGAFIGGASGPVLFGLIIEGVSFTWAWWAASLAFGLAGVAVLAARAAFRRDLQRRPPAQPFGYGGGRSRPRYTVGGSESV